MFCIVNTNEHTVLTHGDGKILCYETYELAANNASIAGQLTGTAGHDVRTEPTDYQHWKPSIAPWLRGHAVTKAKVCLIYPAGDGELHMQTVRTRSTTPGLGDLLSVSFDLRIGEAGVTAALRQLGSDLARLPMRIQREN